MNPIANATPRTWLLRLYKEEDSIQHLIGTSLVIEKRDRESETSEMNDSESQQQRLGIHLFLRD